MQAEEFILPKPGVMVHLSPAYNPPTLRGLKVDPKNPMRFDFILDQGDNDIPVTFGNTRYEGVKAGIQNQEQLKIEANRLIKYFLASVTIPEKDLWVNLSPYEKDRIIPQAFGQSEMGRDLLAQDYMLKQITASLIYPEDELGKEFWKRVYAKAAQDYGTTNIPINTFNKVWIMPDKAVVYEKEGVAYIENSSLKVMLEQDYLALEKNLVIPAQAGIQNENDINTIGSQIVRELILPELTKEVNQGKNFAQLRQIYNSLILATWYKRKLKESLLAQVYADKNKVAGVGYDSLNINSIYHQYLQAFKKGAFNYLKEETDPMTQEVVPRKYFSGGFSFDLLLLGKGNGSGIKKDSKAMVVNVVMNPAQIADPAVVANPEDPISDSIISSDPRMREAEVLRLKGLANQYIDGDWRRPDLVAKEKVRQDLLKIASEHRKKLIKALLLMFKNDDIGVVRAAVYLLGLMGKEGIGDQLEEVITAMEMLDYSPLYTGFLEEGTRHIGPANNQELFGDVEAAKQHVEGNIDAFVRNVLKELDGKEREKVKYYKENGVTKIDPIRGGLSSAEDIEIREITTGIMSAIIKQPPAVILRLNEQVKDLLTRDKEIVVSAGELLGAAGDRRDVLEKALIAQMIALDINGFGRYRSLLEYYAQSNKDFLKAFLTNGFELKFLLDNTGRLRGFLLLRNPQGDEPAKFIRIVVDQSDLKLGRGVLLLRELGRWMKGQTNQKITGVCRQDVLGLYLGYIKAMKRSYELEPVKGNNALTRITVDFGKPATTMTSPAKIADPASISKPANQAMLSTQPASLDSSTSTELIIKGYDRHTISLSHGAGWDDATRKFLVDAVNKMFKEEFQLDPFYVGGALYQLLVARPIALDIAAGGNQDIDVRGGEFGRPVNQIIQQAGRTLPERYGHMVVAGIVERAPVFHNAGKRFVKVSGEEDVQRRFVDFFIKSRDSRIPIYIGESMGFADILNQKDATRFALMLDAETGVKVDLEDVTVERRGHIQLVAILNTLLTSRTLTREVLVKAFRKLKDPNLSRLAAGLEARSGSWAKDVLTVKRVLVDKLADAGDKVDQLEGVLLEIVKSQWNLPVGYFNFDNQSYGWRFSNKEELIQVGPLFFMPIKQIIGDLKSAFEEKALQDPAGVKERIDVVVKEWTMKMGEMDEQNKKRVIFMAPISEESINFPMNQYTGSMIGAMIHYAKDIKDKTFIDLGAGTGVLSLVALALGAKHVVLVESEDFNVEVAKGLLKANGYDEGTRYSVVKENLKDYKGIADQLKGKGISSENMVMGINIGPWSFYGEALSYAHALVKDIKPGMILDGGFHVTNESHFMALSYAEHLYNDLGDYEVRKYQPFSVAELLDPHPASLLVARLNNVDPAMTNQGESSYLPIVARDFDKDAIDDIPIDKWIMGRERFKVKGVELHLVPLSRDLLLNKRVEFFALLNLISATMNFDLEKDIVQVADDPDRFDPTLSFAVLDSKGNPVAMAISHPKKYLGQGDLRKSNKPIYLSKLAVAPYFQGTLVASWLMQWRYEDAIKKGYSRDYWQSSLNVDPIRPGTERTEPFYKKVGGVILAVRNAPPDADHPYIKVRDFSRDITSGLKWMQQLFVREYLQQKAVESVKDKEVLRLVLRILREELLTTSQEFRRSVMYARVLKVFGANDEDIHAIVTHKIRSDKLRGIVEQRLTELESPASQAMNFQDPANVAKSADKAMSQESLQEQLARSSEEMILDSRFAEYIGNKIIEKEHMEDARALPPIKISDNVYPVHVTKDHRLFRVGPLLFYVLPYMHNAPLAFWPHMHQEIIEREMAKLGVLYKSAPHNIFFIPPIAATQHGVRNAVALDAHTMATVTSMLENAKEFKDATVIDIGSGYGILSQIATSLGASRVYAFDNVSALNVITGQAFDATQKDPMRGVSVLTRDMSNQENVDEALDMIGRKARKVIVLSNTGATYGGLNEKSLRLASKFKDLRLIVNAGHFASSNDALVERGEDNDRIMKEAEGIFQEHNIDYQRFNYFPSGESQEGVAVYIARPKPVEIKGGGWHQWARKLFGNTSLAMTSEARQRQIAWKAMMVSEMKDFGFFVSDGELRWDESKNSKGLGWVMLEPRPVERKPIVDIKNMPIVVVDSLVKFKDSTYRLYLGMANINGNRQPVIVKSFIKNPNELVYQGLEKEMVKAQVYDRLGYFPRVYGIVNQDGIYGYAMQYVPGKHLNSYDNNWKDGLGEQARQDFMDNVSFMERKVGIAGISEFILTPHGRLIGVDAGRLEVKMPDEFRKFLQDCNVDSNPDLAMASRRFNDLLLYLKQSFSWGWGYLKIDFMQDKQVKFLQRFSWDNRRSEEDWGKLKKFLDAARKKFPKLLGQRIVQAWEKKDVLELIRLCHPYTLEALHHPDGGAYAYRRHEGMYYWLYAQRLLGKSSGPVTVMNIDPHDDAKGHWRSYGDYEKYVYDAVGVTDANWAVAAIRDGLADAVIWVHGHALSGQNLSWYYDVFKKDAEGVIFRDESVNLAADIGGVSKDKVVLTVDLDQFGLSDYGRELFAGDRLRSKWQGLLTRLTESGFKFYPDIVTADSRGYLSKWAGESWIRESRRILVEEWRSNAVITSQPIMAAPAKTTDLASVANSVGQRILEKGGIDLTKGDKELEVKGEGDSNIKFNIDPAMLVQLKNAQGFVPVIINVQPITDLRKFLGLTQDSTSPKGAAV